LPVNAKNLGKEVSTSMSIRRGPHSTRQQTRHRAGRPEEKTMRFMILIKANADSESGVMPSEEVLTAMGNFNEELVKAGVMLAGEGLHPSSKGARVTIAAGGAGTSVVDGPFAETKELVAGFWLWEVSSLEEAIEWVKRIPADPDADSVVEIRQVFTEDDFGDALTPELREQEARLRAQTAQ
jgi:hypothetical protein